MRENNYQYKRTSKMDWLSQIPSHWFEVRLGSLFNERKSKVSDVDYPPLSVTKNGIVPQLENAAKSNDGDNRKLVLNGDFVINSRSDRKGSSGLSRLDGSVSLINIVLRPIENIDPKFSEYLLKSYFFKEEYYRYGRGIVEDLWTTRYSEMKNMIVPKPPIEEQTAIARFLDYKLAKINRFIQKKKQLIKLLNEQKAAIINQAVTKGLDPNAKMKDSGIEWLGGIPEHWEVRKLKYVAECFPSNIDKHSIEDQKSIRLCNYTDVYKNDYITDDMNLMVATATDEQIEKFTLIQGDVVITKDSETANDIAVPAYVKENLDNVVCGYHLSVLRPNTLIDGEFLFRVLQSKDINIQFELHSNGVTRVGLGVYDLKNAKIPVPPISEQTEIVQYINKEITQINKTISTIERELTLTEEYKTTIIAEAVTGKIDVRQYELTTIEEETFEELEEELNIAAEEEAEYKKQEME